MECVFKETSAAWRHKVFVDEQFTLRSSERNNVFMRMPDKIGDTGIIVSSSQLIPLIGTLSNTYLATIF